MQSDLLEVAQLASEFESGSGSQFSVPHLPECHWPQVREARGVGGGWGGKSGPAGGMSGL